MAISNELKKLRNQNYIPVDKKDGSDKGSDSRIISLIDDENKMAEGMNTGDELSMLVKGIIVSDGKIKIMEIEPVGEEEEKSEVDEMADNVAIKVKPTIQPSPS